MSASTRPIWLLLDPPSEQGYARRGSLREKSNAPEAPFPSIDLILLSGAVAEAGFEPRYLDAQVKRMSWRGVADACRRLRPCGIVSLLTSSRTDDELEKLRELREAVSNAPLYAVGTVHTILNPVRGREILERHRWLDGIVLNIAENNFSSIITDDQCTPQNVAVRRGDDIIVPALSVNYGRDLRMPTPKHAVFKDARYFFPQSKRTPVTCVQMSFGCPYTCEFCLDNAVYRKMLYRNVDDVVAELVDVDRSGFREVYFKDLTFGLNKAITTEFLEKLAAKRLGLRWLCTTRVDVATNRLLRLMKNAGCYGIEFGVESGSRHRRAKNGKPIDDDAIRVVFRRCRALGLETTAFVMIGFEDETEKEIRQTMRFIESIDPTYVSYNIVNALAGTPLEARARREGFLRGDVSDHSYAHSNIRHKYLTLEQLEALHAEATRSFYRRPSAMAKRLLRLESVFELRKLAKLCRVAL